MNTSTKHLGKTLFRGLASLLFLAGGLLFLVGSRAISEFGKVDRVLGEMLGLGLAGLCFGLGMVLKNAGEEDEAEDDQSSTSDDSK